MTVEEGQQLILEKMRRERPTLRQYLRSRMTGECLSHKQWEEAFPGCNQAAYRAGSSNAYLDIHLRIERGEFNPEP